MVCGILFVIIYVRVKVSFHFPRETIKFYERKCKRSAYKLPAFNAARVHLYLALLQYDANMRSDSLHTHVYIFVYGRVLKTAKRLGGCQVYARIVGNIFP